jgi:hypothetical protein
LERYGVYHRDVAYTALALAGIAVTPLVQAAVAGLFGAVGVGAAVRAAGGESALLATLVVLPALVVATAVGAVPAWRGDHRRALVFGLSVLVVALVSGRATVSTVV